MSYRTISTYVDVDVDLEEFSDEELFEELQSRGKVIGDSRVRPLTEPSVLLHSIYEKRRIGDDYQSELDELIYSTIGRIS